MRGGVNGSSRLLVLMVVLLVLLLLLELLELPLFGFAYGLMVVRLLDTLVDTLVLSLDATDVDVDVVPVPVPVPVSFPVRD